MSNTFQLNVRTPEAEIVSKEVDSVRVGTENGPMVIYPHHASLSGTIPFSRLFVRSGNSETEYLVKNGVLFISVETNETKILCYSCLETKDVEYQSAAEYLAYVEEQLKAGANLNQFQMQFLENEKIAMVKQMKGMGKGEGA